MARRTARLIHTYNLDDNMHRPQRISCVPGKYSNGFCHWPQCAWRRADGSWQPASANFTSLATPNAVGSGKTALATLLHEGAHAPAHCCVAP